MICFNLLVLHSMFLFWIFFSFFFLTNEEQWHQMLSCLFLNADLWLSKSHIWISGLRLAVKQYMQVWHYSMQLSFILFLFFYSPHSQWLFIVFFYIFFSSSLDPCGTPPSQANTTTTIIFTLTLHSDVYNTSLIWRRVCLSDSGRQLGRWIVHIIV